MDGLIDENLLNDDDDDQSEDSCLGKRDVRARRLRWQVLLQTASKAPGCALTWLSPHERDW